MTQGTVTPTQRPSLGRGQSHPLQLGPLSCSQELTRAFMALWFFLVFFRNCLRLPEDTYSVMKMTWQGTGGQLPPAQPHMGKGGPGAG